MTYSKEIDKLSAKSMMSAHDTAMADLMCIGYPEVDAFLITHQDMLACDKDYVRKQANKITQTTIFLRYFEARKNAIKRAASKVTDVEKEEIENTELPDKELIAKKVWSIVNGLPSKSKEAVEIMLKYADLMGLKKEEVAEADVVHYYLPLTCSKCELYNKNRK